MESVEPEVKGPTSSYSGHLSSNHCKLMAPGQQSLLNDFLYKNLEFLNHLEIVDMKV